MLAKVEKKGDFETLVKSTCYILQLLCVSEGRQYHKAGALEQGMLKQLDCLLEVITAYGYLGHLDHEDPFPSKDN